MLVHGFCFFKLVFIGPKELRTGSCMYTPSLNACVQANISQQYIELETSSLDQDEAQGWDGRSHGRTHGGGLTRGHWLSTTVVSI